MCTIWDYHYHIYKISRSIAMYNFNTWLTGRRSHQSKFFRSNFPSRPGWIVHSIPKCRSFIYLFYNVFMCECELYHDTDFFVQSWFCMNIQKAVHLLSVLVLYMFGIPLNSTILPMVTSNSIRGRPPGLWQSATTSLRSGCAVGGAQQDLRRRCSAVWKRGIHHDSSINWWRFLIWGKRW